MVALVRRLLDAVGLFAGATGATGTLVIICRHHADGCELGS